MTYFEKYFLLEGYDGGYNVIDIDVIWKGFSCAEYMPKIILYFFQQKREKVSNKPTY